VSLIINNEEHVLRALADTGASSSIILESYMHIPQPHSSKQMTVIQPPGVQWAVSLLQLNLEYVCDIFTHRFQPQETNVYFLSSGTYDMIVGNGLKPPWKIRHNHELQ
jgi:hypothetical protein